MLAACIPDALIELTNCITHLRELYPSTKTAIGVYPDDPLLFIKDFPNRYTEDKMPVASKVSLEQIEHMSMITSCRGTNKKLKTSAS